MDHQPRSRWALLLTALLLVAALAGCTTPETDGGSPASGEDGDEPPAMTREEAIASYQTAMASLAGDEAEPPERFSMRMEMTELGGTESSGHIEVLIDTVAEVAVMEMSGELAEGTGGTMMQPEANESLVFGQVAKTNFFGTTTHLFGMYNESAEQVSGLEATEPEQGPPGEGPPDPAQLMAAFTELGENATVTHEPTTHNGQAALRVHAANDQGMNVTALIYLDPLRPAVVEGIAPQSPDSSELAHMRMTFGYGDDATHSLEEALVRAESLTILNTSDSGSAFMMGGNQGEDQGRNWTIQPSTGSGTIPLSEVELEVHNDTEESGPPLLVLPLEAGQAETENGSLRATYVDADGDGHVSEGDRIEISGNGSSGLTVTLHDEVTGLRLAPGPGILGLIAAGLAALFVARRD